jgi:uncharacterized protein YunC (DUF1805 family)
MDHCRYGVAVACGLAFTLLPGCGRSAAESEAARLAALRAEAEARAKVVAADAAAPQLPDDEVWQGLEPHAIQLGQTLLLVKGSRGIVACPYLNVETFSRGGEACAIVSAPQLADIPGGKVVAVTPKAQELGIEVGMSGREALDKIR